MGIGSLTVDHVQLNATYLVKALNDHGPLGCTSRSLLKQQHAALGGLQTMGLNFDSKRLEREAQHFHIIRQIS